MREWEELFNAHEGDVVDFFRLSHPRERVIHLPRAQNHAPDLYVWLEWDIFVSTHVVARVAVGDDASE